MPFQPEAMGCRYIPSRNRSSGSTSLRWCSQRNLHPRCVVCRSSHRHRDPSLSSRGLMANQRQRTPSRFNLALPIQSSSQQRPHPLSLLPEPSGQRYRPALPSTPSGRDFGAIDLDMDVRQRSRCCCRRRKQRRNQQPRFRRPFSIPRRAFPMVTQCCVLGFQGTTRPYRIGEPSLVPLSLCGIHTDSLAAKAF